MTNKQNPEEISALDSSKHGDSPNSLGKPDSIIEAISLMTKQLVSSITTLNYSMDHSFTEMKETLGNLAYVEESANEEGSVNWSRTRRKTDKGQTRTALALGTKTYRGPATLITSTIS